jgi:hypothetical protein
LEANIRVRLRRLAMANTLAYYATATITATESFIEQAPGVNDANSIFAKIFFCPQSLTSDKANSIPNKLAPFS